MASYENMLILRHDLEDEEREKLLEKIKLSVQRTGGEVTQVIDWGKRRLSYEIKDTHEGHYFLVYFHGDRAVLKELEHFYRVNDEVLRFMIISLEK